MKPGPEITCIVVTHNNESEIKECLDSMLSQEAAADIIVYDNNSSDTTVSKLDSYRNSVTIIKGDRNLGYSMACNRAFEGVSTRYVCFLNPDTVIKTDTLTKLYEFMEDNGDVSVCGPRFISSSGKPKNSIAMFPTLTDQILPKWLVRLFSGGYYRKSSFNVPSEVETLVGACFFVRSDNFRKQGGFDEDYFLFLEETDFCWRIRRDHHKVYFLPGVNVMHKGGGSKESHRVTSKIEYYKSLVSYFRKNNGMASYICLLLLLPFKFLLESVFIIAVNVLTFFMVTKSKKRMVEVVALLAWSIMCYPRGWGINKSS